MRRSNRVAVGFREFAGGFAGLNGGSDFYARDGADLGREGAASLKVFPERCEKGGVEPRKRVSGKFNVCLPAGVAVRRRGGSGRPVSLPDPTEIETEAGQDRGPVNAVGVVEHLNGESGDSRCLIAVFMPPLPACGGAHRRQDQPNPAAEPVTSRARDEAAPAVHSRFDIPGSSRPLRGGPPRP